MWGRKRFVFHRFSWASSRIWRQRLSWYAKDLGIEDVTETSRLLGRDGWGRVVPALLKVVLPESCYQARDPVTGIFRWDEPGWRAYCNDLNHYARLRTDDRRVQLSRFRFYVAVARSWDMKWSRARIFASLQLERSGLGRQRHLESL